MKKDIRKAAGFCAEEAAAQYLESHGYKLLARNFRTRFGEVDIVAADGPVLVICEVRSSTDKTRNPLESVKFKKTKRLSLLGAYCRSYFEFYKKNVRFDVIGIIIHSRDFEVTHISNAFDVPAFSRGIKY